MRYIEDNVQISIVNYLTIKGFLFTSTCGGVWIKNKAMQKRNKDMGYQKGAPDLIVWIKGGTLCIEVKKPKTMRYSVVKKRMVIDKAGGRQSDNQKEFDRCVTKIPGHYYIVADNVADVDKFINEMCITPI